MTELDLLNLREQLQEDLRTQLDGEVSDDHMDQLCDRVVELFAPLLEKLRPIK